MDPVVAWLLDPSDPAVRAQALVDLAGRSPQDPEVREARAAMATRGSAARVLADLRMPAARDATALYRPKYGAPFHRLVTLGEMGVPASVPAAGALLDACLDAFVGPEGPLRDGEVCVAGNLARSAIRMGRGDDPRVTRALQHLAAIQLPDGGWHCWPDEVPHGTVDAWEALGAFAALPEKDRPRDVVRRGVEFLLAQRLGMDDAYAPWRRIHFPRHYYYDALVGLDLATALGDPRDERLGPALAWLEGKRGADGRWRLDAQHPDLGEGAGYEMRDAASVAPLVVEPTGAPSRWATLAAMRVLRRAGRVAP